jgi:hypothetical protein
MPKHIWACDYAHFGCVMDTNNNHNTQMDTKKKHNIACYVLLLSVITRSNQNVHNSRAQMCLELHQTQLI